MCLQNPYYIIIYKYKNDNPKKSILSMQRYNIKKTIVIRQNNNFSITKRTMLSRVTQTTAKLSLEAIAPTIIQSHPYSRFIVNDLDSTQDTSKVGHKTVTKVECDSSDCNEVNCANNNSICDINTETTSIVGHLTHCPQSVEKERQIVDLENAMGPRGPSKVVIYNEKESFPDEKLYEGYSHSDTVNVQKDVNTEKLNKLTENLPELQDDDQK
jgi:hypothetical protein